MLTVHLANSYIATMQSFVLKKLGVYQKPKTSKIGQNLHTNTWRVLLSQLHSLNSIPLKSCFKNFAGVYLTYASSYRVLIHLKSLTVSIYIKKP